MQRVFALNARLARKYAILKRSKSEICKDYLLVLQVKVQILADAPSLSAFGDALLVWVEEDAAVVSACLRQRE